MPGLTEDQVKQIASTFVSSLEQSLRDNDHVKAVNDIKTLCMQHISNESDAEQLRVLEIFIMAANNIRSHLYMMPIIATASGIKSLADTWEGRDTNPNLTTILSLGSQIWSFKDAELLRKELVELCRPKVRLSMSGPR